MLKIIKNFIWTVITLIILIAILIFTTNIYVLKTGSDLVADNAKEMEYSTILTFGASVYGNKVSPVLAKRLDKVYEIYNANGAENIIVSGDHQSSDYNEVQAMKDYLIKKGIPEEKITMDHSGIDTYYSVARLKNNNSNEKYLFVTQDEHLKRALYYAEKIGVDAVGIPCENYEKEEYEHQRKREFLARIKAFVLCDIFNCNSEKFDKFMRIVFDENID